MTRKTDKKCEHCQTSFPVFPCELRRKYCSLACSKLGKPHSGSFKKGHGRLYSFTPEREALRRERIRATKISRRPSHKLEVARIRRSFEYRSWRKEVFERDDYTCVGCGVRSGNGKEVKLNADHIEAFSLILIKHGIDSFKKAQICAELWNIANGRTLCVPCHKETDNYAGKAIKQKKAYAF